MGYRVLVLLSSLVLTCMVSAQKTNIQITARFFQTKAAIDVNNIKAIGSPATKASPSILHVSKEEAARIAKFVTEGGGVLVGSPTIVARKDEQAKIESSGDKDSYSLDVIATTRSDMITLKFRIAVTTVTETKRIQRSASATARVLESKALLIIENPRNGQPGFFTIIEAKRVKTENR